MGKKVAIVGGGCSGLAALWALKSTDHEVHLFEADSMLEGHINTVSYGGPKGQKIDLDTSFIAMNTATCPNFFAFLNHIDVKPIRTDTNFSVSRDQGRFEWGSATWSTMFAQKRNIFNPHMWRLIFDVIRFNQFAFDILQHDDDNESETKRENFIAQESIGDYLDREGYSQSFRDDYLIPVTAALSSTNPDECLIHLPAVIAIRLMWNHHLLGTVNTRCLTIPGGSRQYIDAILSGIPRDQIHMKSRVTALGLCEEGPVMLTVNDTDLIFDHIILATHGGQALEMLRPIATEREIDILSGFKSSRDIAVLHSDRSLMPKRKIAWSPWNYLTESPFPPTGNGNLSKVCLTFYMNLVQNIPESSAGPILVTLNPLRMPDPRLAQSIWERSHPLYNAASIRSRKLLPSIQNTRNISYCGAWTRHGSHEDGFSSGLSVAVNHLGATLPFDFGDSTCHDGRGRIRTWQSHIARILVLLIHITIVVSSRIFDMFDLNPVSHILMKQKSR